LAATVTFGVAIAKGDEALVFQACECPGIADIIAFAMGNADIDDLPRRIGAGEGCVAAFDLEMLPLAGEPQVGIANQHAGQQPCFAGNLEAIADGQNKSAACAVAAHGVHDRCTRGNRTRAEIVAIGETTGQDHEVRAARQGHVGVPGMRHRRAGLLQGPGDVAFAIGAGKGDDGCAHGTGPQAIRSMR
jgi:hypothetical protein